MAFFKFQWLGQFASKPQGNASPAQAESVDAMRRRARQRLMGAFVLVVLAVIGLPLLFDTQPRPVSVDIAVNIPDRANSKPLVDTTQQRPLSATAGLDPKEEVVSAKTDTPPEAKPTISPTTNPSDSKDAGPRFVVQVGAFNDDSKLREVRAKLEKEGLKTYTQVVQTKEGALTRVRVGPFSSRDEADKVARKMKQLQLQPQVLTL